MSLSTYAKGSVARLILIVFLSSFSFNYWKSITGLDGFKRFFSVKFFLLNLLTNRTVAGGSIGGRRVTLVAHPAGRGRRGGTERARTGTAEPLGQHRLELQCRAQLHAERVGQVFLGEQWQPGAVDALVTKVL